ncbi:four helix bundle protein [Gemmatimonas phototrophica]|nr:four helix bundle protein [Gemmatimonas phototrophica]
MSNTTQLRVLDAALHMVEEVHRESLLMPVERVPGLRAQLLRAVDAVPANIAEGARGSRSQFANFLRIARGSADEVAIHLQVARRAGAMSETAYWRCENSRVVVCKMLSRLIRTLDEHAAHAVNDAY